VIALLLAGCKKASKLDSIALGEYNPDIAFPLINANVTASDLLGSFSEGTNLEEGSDGSLTFVYEGDGFGLKSTEVTQLIPNFSFPMVDTAFGFPYNLPNNTFVDFVNIRSGIIGVAVSNNHAEPVEFTLTIPDITLNGVPFEQTEIVATTGIFVETYPVAGYVLTPNADSLNFYYTAKLVNSGTFVTLYSAPDPLVALDSMRYSYAEGFLGNGTFPIPRDTIEIDLFDQVSGNVFFEEPSITVTIKNSFGFPVKGKFDILDAHLIDGTVLPLINSTLNNGFTVDHPTFAEVGQIKQTVFVVDNTNSNINTIIGQPIAFFDYKVTPQANPTNDTTQLGFLTDSSELSLDILVELPLYGTAENFTISDTLAISLAIYEKMDYAKLRVLTDNGFPVDVYTQVYFLNSNYEVLDSLATNASESLLASASIDAGGRVTTPTTKTTEYELLEDRFDVLKQEAKYLKLKSSFSTINNGQESVRIYSDYHMGIKIGVLAGIRPLD